MAFEVTADTAATAYADLDALDEAAEVRLGGVAWLATDEDVKDQIRTTASLEIDTLDWIGTRASTTQELEWPRSGTEYSSNAWPSRLVNAVIDLSLYKAAQLSADATADVVNATSSALKREKVGPIESEYFDRAVAATALEQFPPSVQRWLRPLVRSSVSAGWGRACVSRGS